MVPVCPDTSNHMFYCVKQDLYIRGESTFVELGKASGAIIMASFVLSICLLAFFLFM